MSGGRGGRGRFDRLFSRKISHLSWFGLVKEKFFEVSRKRFRKSI
jgi:hypothetical protein